MKVKANKVLKRHEPVIVEEDPLGEPDETKHNGAYNDVQIIQESEFMSVV